MISSIDRHFRMTGMNEFDSLVARKDAHELDLLASCFLQKLYCRVCTNPRCKCRVDNNNFPLSNINRQLEVILYRLQCLFVSVKADMSYLCSGKKTSSAVYHAKACP